MAARAAQWKPDPEQRNLVASLTAYGLPIEEQLLLVKGPGGRALRAEEFAEFFSPEILSGRAKANAQLGKALYDRALAGNTRALRDWQKQNISETVETRELAAWIGVGSDVIADMEKRGIVHKTAYGVYPLRESITAAFAHLREVAAGRADADPQSGGALVTERARLARELADQASMRNAAMRGETVYIRDIIELLHECNRTVTTRLLSLPAEASPQLHGCKTVLEHQLMLRALITEALEGLCREFGTTRRQGNGSAGAQGSA